MPIEHIIFDLDHTLWDFDSNSFEAKEELFERYNLSARFSSFEDFHERYLRHNTELWSKYSAGQITKHDVSTGRFYLPLRECAVSSSAMDDMQLAEELGKFYLMNTAERKHLMPDALEVLNYLKTKGYALHVATNGFKEVQHIKIDGSGIGQYITGRFISDEIGVMKPSADFFNVVMKHLGTTPDRCAMVGDNPEADIEGARQFGLVPIFYNSRALDVDMIGVHKIKSLTELKSIF